MRAQNRKCEVKNFPLLVVIDILERMSSRTFRFHRSVNLSLIFAAQTSLSVKISSFIISWLCDLISLQYLNRRTDLTRVTRDSNEVTDKFVALGAHFTPFLCQCSVLRVFKAEATQIRRKSKQTLESPRIERGTSSSEGRALTN